MPRRQNRQARSVGNLGDILKHAALFELASMLARAGGAVRYVETHTFLLHAPLADAERWTREVDRLAAMHPAFAGYAAFQRDALARTGRHRCSSGVVLDVLGDRRLSAVMGEVDGATRAVLHEQIREERLANVVVTDDDVAALRAASVEPGDSLLVHVDPFVLPPERWASLAPGLDALCAGAAEAVVVVYRYTRGARSAWPAAPRGTRGPVAQVRGGPHEIAAYASPGAAGAVLEICGALGWGPVGPERD
jgi:23S rRNA A2030 N6-methylase RlmJ